ncbi:MAG: hypothetical protein IT355_20750 [Gemmatimonadaceae bacterium]|nr:hypothetical protein [Gemmatimonadaceae bacterium]
MNTRARCAQVLRRVAVALGLTSVAASAQAAGDESLLARADSITVGDYCSATRSVLRAPAVLAALQPDEALFDAALDRVCDPRVAALRLRELTASGAAPLAAVARLRQEAYRTVQAAPLDSAMQLLAGRLRQADVRPVVLAAVGDSVNRDFVRATETARLLFLLSARDRTLQRLANYERKLGPQSPKLNGVEVLLNYAAQRWVRGFRGSATGGPSPWEVITAYVPTYATVAGGRAMPAAASELGVRHYNFARSWGTPGWRSLIKPPYISLGAAVASDRLGTLTVPWEDRTRLGAFLGWGETKLAWIPGRRGQVLLTRQIQLVPFTF